MALATEGGATMRDNIVTLFGAKQVQALLPLDLSVTLTESAEYGSRTRAIHGAAACRVLNTALAT